MSTTPGPVMEFFGRVAYEYHLMRPLLPTYLHLLVSVIFPIFTAAHASLARPSSAAIPEKKKKSKSTDSDEEEEKSSKIETLTPSDAIIFPLLAGSTLAGLYFILKWLQDPAWLNYILGLYFSQVGLFFAVKFIKDGLATVRSFFLPLQYSARGKVWQADIEDTHFVTIDAGELRQTSSPFAGLLRYLPLPKFIVNRLWRVRQLFYTKASLELHAHKIITFKSPVELIDLVSLVISSGIVYYHTFIDKPWFLTNALGFSFCYGSLQFLTPGTAWTGTLLLSALFFYDIYFVFYTPMMVTVATKLDVPIKLLFPRPDGCVYPVGAEEGSADMVEYLQCIAKKRTMAMIGLGDIVIPGMMLAFALRFDLYLFYLRKMKSKFSNQSTDTPSEKSQYRSVKGLWGERFWTNRKLYSNKLRAKSFPKTYFYSTVIGYLIGMIVTMIVMQVFNHAQPALLYLVPGVLISFWGTALVKGDLKTLWNYSEVPDEEKEDEKKKNNKKNPKSEKSDKTIEGTASEKKGHDINAEDEINDKTSEIQETADESTTPEKPKAKDKKDDSKLDDNRRLFYFAITLPKPSSTPKNSSTKSIEQTSMDDEGEQSTSQSFSDDKTNVQQQQEDIREQSQSQSDESLGDWQPITQQNNTESSIKRRRKV